MSAGEDGVKKDPAAAPTFEAGDGDLSGARPVGQAGVDFGGQGSTRPGGGDLRLRPQDLPGDGSGGRDRAFDAPAQPGGGLDRAFNVPGAGLGGGGRGLRSPDGRLTRHVGGADPAPAGRRARGDPHAVPERDPLRRVTLHETWPPTSFQRAGGARGGMVRHPAVLALLLGGMAALIIGDGEPDAPWLMMLSQLGALLAWLAGCITLFLSMK